MSPLPNVKTNNINKNIINNKNQTTIQDARPNKSSNNPDSYCSDNNGWTTQTNKRNLSSSSNTAFKPPSQNLYTNIIKKKKNIKKIFATRNRFEILTQVDPFETTSSENIPLNFNPTDAENTIIKPPPPIFVKGVEDFPELCTTLIELIGVDNFMCKSTTRILVIHFFHYFSL